MSEVYFKGVGAQSFRISTPGVMSSSSETRRPLWVPRSAMDWDIHTSMAMRNFFKEKSHPFRRYEEIPFEEPLRSEIRRFFIALDAYIESSNPVIPINDLLIGSTLPDFAKTLKRIKRKSFETTWGVDNFEFPEWWNEVPSYIIHDIGDIFNYAYLPFFKTEVEDYKYGFQDVHIEKERLRSFKEMLRSILPDRDTFEKIDPSEILAQMSSSIAWDADTQKKYPHYKLKEKCLSFSKKRHSSKRCTIPISPENIRDSIILDPRDLNTISLIDQQTMEVLRRMPNHIHLKDKDLCTKRYQKLYDKYRYFLHRDIQKEGITKPRELLKAMLEVLSEVYPDIPIYQETSFYDDYEIILEDGTVIHPQRGHGLGMANSLTTLMQLVIHEMIVDELQNDIPLMQSDCLCINDDFVAGFLDEEHVDAYWDKESEVLDELSIIREPSKSFVAEFKFVLAERYFTSSGEYEKESYQRRELLLPLACVNITHAKKYFESAQTYITSKICNDYISEYSSYWGYEFYPTEFSYPSLVGGWINEKMKGIDMSLRLLDSLPLKSYVYRGFKASMAFLKSHKRGPPIRSPFMLIYNVLDIPEEYAEYFDFLPDYRLTEKYGRVLSKSNQIFEKFWEDLRKERQRIFKENYSCTYKELIGDILENNPTTQFYPCEMMIDHYHPFQIVQISIDDIYIDPNPRVAALNCWKDLNYPFKECYSIRFTALDNISQRSMNLFSKEIQRCLKSEVISNQCTGSFHEAYWPSDSYKPEEQYINPIKVGIVASLLDWGLGYPELRKEYEHPLIKEKRKIFGQLFSLQELLVISRLRLKRSFIKSVVEFCQRNNWTFLECIGMIEDHYDELFPPPPEVSEEETQEEENIEFQNLQSLKVETPDNEIWIEDCLEPGFPKFYSWRQDRTPFTVNNPRVLNILEVLDQFVTVATWGSEVFTAEIQRIRDTIESDKDPLMSLVFHRSGVSSVSEEINKDVLDSEAGILDFDEWG